MCLAESRYVAWWAPIAVYLPFLCIAAAIVLIATLTWLFNYLLVGNSHKWLNPIFDSCWKIINKIIVFHQNCSFYIFTSSVCYFTWIIFGLPTCYSSSSTWFFPSVTLPKPNISFIYFSYPSFVVSAIFKSLSYSNSYFFVIKYFLNLLFSFILLTYFSPYFEYF